MLELDVGDAVDVPESVRVCVVLCIPLDVDVADRVGNWLAVPVVELVDEQLGVVLMLTLWVSVIVATALADCESLGVGELLGVFVELVD